MKTKEDCLRYLKQHFDTGKVIAIRENSTTPTSHTVIVNAACNEELPKGVSDCLKKMVAAWQACQSENHWLVWVRHDKRGAAPMNTELKRIVLNDLY